MHETANINSFLNFSITINHEYLQRVLQHQSAVKGADKSNSEGHNVYIEEIKQLRNELNEAKQMNSSLKSKMEKLSNEWKKKEIKLVDECSQLRIQLKTMSKSSNPDVEQLQEKIKDLQEINVKLKLDFDTYREKCSSLETLCLDLRKIITDEQLTEKVYMNDAVPASVKHYLSSSPSSVMSTITQVFGNCLSKAKCQSYAQREHFCQRDTFTPTKTSMNVYTIEQNLPTSVNDKYVTDIIKERDRVKKENMDLNRQVKELEQIVRRRTHSNYSTLSDVIQGPGMKPNQQDEIINNLKKELLEKQHIIIDLKKQLLEAKDNYDRNLLSLQEKVVNIQEESIKLKEDGDKRKQVTIPNHGPKCKKRGRTCDPPPFSVRNFRHELTVKEREIQSLNKQMEELRKTNKRLAREKEQVKSFALFKNYSKESIVSSKDMSPVDENVMKNKTFAKDYLVDKNCNILKSDNTDDTESVSKLQHQVAEQEEIIKKLKDHLKHLPKDKEKTEEKLLNNICESESNNLSRKFTAKNVNNEFNYLLEKLNNLEMKHQNLQKITCELLSLLTKENKEDEKTSEDRRNNNQYRAELSRFIAVLKEFSD